MKKNKHQQMRRLYNRWQSSGVSKADFASKSRIQRTTFYYWIKKFEKESLKPIPGKGFSQVSVGEPAGHLPVTATIHYPDGIRIEWHGSAESVHLLKTLI